VMVTYTPEYIFDRRFSRGYASAHAAEEYKVDLPGGSKRSGGTQFWLHSGVDQPIIEVSCLLEVRQLVFLAASIVLHLQYRLAPKCS
jgi:hypothetical protein